MTFIYRPHNELSTPFDNKRCAASVAQGGRMTGFYQCQRKGKYEDNKGNLWCRQHHPDTVKKRREDMEGEWAAEQERKERIWRRRAAETSACKGVPTDVLENIRVVDILERQPPGGR